MHGIGFQAHVEQPGAQPVGEIEHGGKGERVGDPYQDNRDWQVAAEHHGQYCRDQHL